MKAIICVGISASGKSTFARSSFHFELNRDNIRELLTTNDGKEWKWSNWSWKRESKVTEIIQEKLAQYAKEKFDIIISDTNLNQERNKQLEAKLIALGYEVEFKYFPLHTKKQLNAILID